LRRSVLAALTMLCAVAPSGCHRDEDVATAALRSPAALTEARDLTALDRTFERGFDGSGVTVAVLDTGVDGSHPDLAGRVVDEACFCSFVDCCPGGGSEQVGQGAARDVNGHGTHVAGIIASQGVRGPRGGAPGVRIVAVKVLSDTLALPTLLDVAMALDWLRESHPEVKLVNASLGGGSLQPGDCDGLQGTLSAAVAALHDAGAMVVASSGNEGSATSMLAPACVSSVLSVSAVWDADVGSQDEYCNEPITGADFPTCFGNTSPTTDLLAPGGVIESTWLDGGTHELVGTSMAAPMVTACAAVLKQAEPTLGVDVLEALLESTGVPVLDTKSGRTYPRIDCAAALAALIPEPMVDAGAMTVDAGSDENDAGTDSNGDAGAGPTDDEDAGGELRDAAMPPQDTPMDGGATRPPQGQGPPPTMDGGGPGDVAPDAEAADGEPGDVGSGDAATMTGPDTGCGCAAATPKRALGDTLWPLLALVWLRRRCVTAARRALRPRREPNLPSREPRGSRGPLPGHPCCAPSPEPGSAPRRARSRG
jgi:subtilisin family serine protease